MPADPLPLRSVWFAFVIGIPALAIALLCTLFAVAYTGPQFDLEIINDRVVGGTSDRVTALALATVFGALGIFAMLNLRTCLREWGHNSPTRQTDKAKRAILLVLLSLSAVHVAAQASDFTLLRFGSLAVSDVEVAQITELVAYTGRRPWLLRSPHSMMLDVRFADLFLEPDVLGTRVYRGRMLGLTADGKPFAAPSSPWKIRETYSYAYLPTKGRKPGDLFAQQDADWPFTVYGTFDDETLISIVEFIRARPRLPNAREGTLPRQLSGAPISVIAQRDDGILVGQRTGDSQGERVWIVRQPGQWVITKFEMWIA